MVRLREGGRRGAEKEEQQERREEEEEEEAGEQGVMSAGEPGGGPVHQVLDLRLRGDVLLRQLRG